MRILYNHEEACGDIYAYETKGSIWLNRPILDLTQQGWYELDLESFGTNRLMFWHGYAITSIMVKEWNNIQTELIIETSLVRNIAYDCMPEIAVYNFSGQAANCYNEEYVK